MRGVDVTHVPPAGLGQGRGREEKAPEPGFLDCSLLLLSSVG